MVRGGEEGEPKVPKTALYTILSSQQLGLFAHLSRALREVLRDLMPSGLYLFNPHLKMTLKSSEKLHKNTTGFI